MRHGRILLGVAALTLAGCSAAAQPARSQPATGLTTAAPTASAVGSVAPPAPTVSPAVSAGASASASWSGLDWAEPAALPLGANIYDLIAWQGAYVAVGDVFGADGTAQAAAWTSPDLRTWTQTLLEAAPNGEASIARVVEVGGRLLGVGYSGLANCDEPAGEGPPCDAVLVGLWTSEDGTHWTKEATPSTFDGAKTMAVVSSGDEVALVGYRGWNDMAVWRSADGVTWRADAVPASFADAHPIGLAAVGASGLILTGRSGGHEPNFDTNEAGDWTPAAWWWDGAAWQAATVTGAETALGDEVGQPYVGRDGIVAPGSLDGTFGWTTVDGRVWSPVPQPPGDLVSPWASDGVQVVGRTSAAAPGESFALSTEGRTWTALVPTGATQQAPGWDAESSPTAVSAFLVPAGLVIIGSDRQGVPLTWLATPVR